MLQEDSNGETSFEIIDKKADDSITSGDKTESSSTMSSFSIPSPSVVVGGSLLSNLPPPLKPDVTLWQTQPVAAPAPLPTNLLPPIQPFPHPQFSAAIPPSKGVQHGPVPQTSVDSGSGGLISWMKDAVSSGGILSKVAEKAKSSVDSLITTLDPQMSEFIYSGGDMEILVVSHDQDEVTPIREAAFSVFGKASVSGANIKVEERKHRAVGLEDGVKQAQDKIKIVSSHNITIAVEDILWKQNDQWFDLSVILLKDAEKQITVHTFTQTIPIQDTFIKQAEKEMPSYAKGCDSEEKLLSAYLQIVKSSWYQEIAGVSRKEMLFLATKTLLTVYKNKLANN